MYASPARPRVAASPSSRLSVIALTMSTFRSMAACRLSRTFFSMACLCEVWTISACPQFPISSVPFPLAFSIFIGNISGRKPLPCPPNQSSHCACSFFKSRRNNFFDSSPGGSHGGGDGTATKLRRICSYAVCVFLCTAARNVCRCSTGSSFLGGIM